MAEGWIKFYRNSLDHWLYTEYRPLTRREAWETILLTVNYEPSKSLIKGTLYDCDSGQSLLSIESWAKKFVWSLQQVKTFFRLLEADGMIKTEGMQYTTRLTVCNWNTYQSSVTNEKLTDNEPLTNEQLTANQPLTTIKEREEYKERKENIRESNASKLASRAKVFYDSLIPFSDSYPPKMLREFYDYWIEPNKSKTKMRFELEKTWETERRLRSWAAREKVDFKGDNTGKLLSYNEVCILWERGVPRENFEKKKIGEKMYWMQKT